MRAGDVDRGSRGSVARRALVLSLSLWLNGCRSPTDYVCPTILLPGVSVTVVDATTSAPPAARSTLVVTDGAYADSAVTAAGMGVVHSAAAAYGRGGNFAVVVHTPGYADWARAGVQVSVDDCGHPNTARFTIALQPLGP